MPADWDKQNHVATHVSVTGLERTLLTLYRETGDRRYLDFCIRQRALPEWDLGIVIGRRELIEGHVYAYLARCLAQLELYRLQPDESCCGRRGGPIHFMTAQDGMSHHRRGRPVGNLDRRSGRTRGPGRDVRHGVPTSRLRQPACGWRAIRATATSSNA